MIIFITKISYTLRATNVVKEIGGGLCCPDQDPASRLSLGLWHRPMAQFGLRQPRLTSEGIVPNLMAHFHCQTWIQIRTRIRIPNPITTWYYAAHVSTDSDSDSDPFPIVSA